MGLLMFSLVLLLLQILFHMLSIMFTKTSPLYCCSCIRLFIVNYVYVALYGIMHTSIIRYYYVLQRARLLLSGGIGKITLIMLVFPTERKFMLLSHSCKMASKRAPVARSISMLLQQINTRLAPTCNWMIKIIISQ